MKQLFANALTALSTGIFFALGVAVCFYAFEHLSAAGTSGNADLERIKLPTDLRIGSHERVEGTPNLTIVGVVENAGASAWSNASIEAEVLADGARVNECHATVNGAIPPGTRRAFQIECWNVSGTNLPESIGYRLQVSSALKAR